MLTLTRAVRVFACAAPVDMRKGFDGLSALVEQHLGGQLLKGDVFSKDQIEAYIELKWDEVTRWETTPSPVEFDMYYSA